MTKQSHTPGPWRISTTHQRVERCDGRVLVAICPTNADNMPDSIPQVEAEANARLIAMAPEMAEALRAYALPALNYLSIKAMTASDRAEFKDREAKVLAILAKLDGDA